MPNRLKRQDILIIVLLVAGLGTSWFILRPSRTPLMDKAERVQAQTVRCTLT